MSTRCMHSLVVSSDDPFEPSAFGPKQFSRIFGDFRFCFRSIHACAVIHTTKNVQALHPQHNSQAFQYHSKDQHPKILLYKSSHNNGWQVGRKGLSCYWYVMMNILL